MNPETKAFWIIAFSGVLTIYGGFMVFSRWCVNSPAVSDEKMRRLHVGMTQDEVRRLLGEPGHQTVLRDRAEWRYGHRLKQHVLRLRFNKAGQLQQYEHLGEAEMEHQEPG